MAHFAIIFFSKAPNFHVLLHHFHCSNFFKKEWLVQIQGYDVAKFPNPKSPICPKPRL